MRQDEPGSLREVLCGDLGATVPGCQSACRPDHHDVGAVTVDVCVDAGTSRRRESFVGDDYLGDELSSTLDPFAELVAILFPCA